MPRPVERRTKQRGEGAEIWTDDDRKVIGKLAPLFEKYNNRHGKQEEKPKDKSFLEELGILG